MKKILSLIITIFMLSVANVYAAGSINVSTGSISMQPGGSKSFTITAVNAAGRVDISSSNGSVAIVSSSSEWIENGSVTITVSAKGEGSAQIIVSLTDVATFDGEVLTGQKVINVTSKKVEADKTDATLSNITIEGYSINFKRNEFNYSLDVPNNVTSLKISAKTSSSAAKVAISGGDKLELGNNKITIKVTAGNGTKKEYVINVNRKDDIPEAVAKNLQEVINTTTKDTVALKITDDTTITKEIISIIKSSGKNIIINKYNESGIIVYSWILNNATISDQDTFDAAINTQPDVLEKMQEATNYSEGLYLELKALNIDDGQLKIYVGDKYDSDSKINVLSYKDDNLKLHKEALKVENGYVTFDINNADNYILTRAALSKNKDIINIDGSFNYFALVAALELVGLIGLGTFTFIKLKRK